MGDRVLFQVVSRDGRQVSPVIYGHWCGDRAPEIVRNLRARMEPRGEDVQYTAARLVQEVCKGDPDGYLSVGIWNQSLQLKAEDSHGDAGCVVVTWDGEGRLVAKCCGGYLAETGDGDCKVRE